MVERVPVGLELRRVRNEFLETHADVRLRLHFAVPVLDRVLVVGDGIDEQARVPLSVRFDFDAQRQPVVVQLRGLRRADACLADVVVALVAELVNDEEQAAASVAGDKAEGLFE